MKHSLYSILIVLLLTLAIRANACGPFERMYLAGHYFMFRACGDNMTGDVTRYTQLEEQRRKENCREWAAITSHSIPHADILDVVYHWDQNQIEELHRAVSGEKPNYTTCNRFASWIVSHKDSEVADFLLLAKSSETLRVAMGNVWYYPVPGDELSQGLLRIIDTSRAYAGHRLGDRYALQAMRAMFALGQYDECLDYWAEHQAIFHQGVIQRMAQGYVAGSLSRTGQREEAVAMYISIGDYHEAHKCSDSIPVFERWLYETLPDHELHILNVQASIHKIEQWKSAYYGEVYQQLIRQRYDSLYPTVRKFIHDHRCRDMAPWYYAGAYIADQLQLDAEARSYIEQARNANPQGDLKHAIRVFDFYLTVKQAEVYDEALERKVYSELRWLDDMIVGNLTRDTRRTIVDNGINNHICGYSQYYWNDMMRRIVISELVPLCQRSGYQTRALQYLNMADYRIFNLVRDVSFSRWRFDGEDYQTLPDTIMTMAAYHRYPDFHNEYDYSNDYFMNLDSVGVKYLKRLSYRMEHPQNQLDVFLAERGYTDPMYLYDIIGTQLIAEGKFAESVTYLSKVDAAFNRSRNVFPHCNVDPFTLAKHKPDSYYKLHYAQAMCRLEAQIAACDDPNAKARLKLQYARGMINSVGRECWPLTSYYWGRYDLYPLYSQYQRRLADQTESRAQSVKACAFALFTDDEAAARACFEWQMYATAVHRYPATAMAEFIRGHCDELRDYRVMADLPPGRE